MDGFGQSGEKGLNWASLHQPPVGLTKWSLEVDRLKLGGKAYLFTVPIHFACQQLYTTQKNHPNSYSS